MEYKTFFAQDRAGNALGNAEATVKLAGQEVRADIFDRLGNHIPNPIVTDADGAIRFAATTGSYDVLVSKLGSVDAQKLQGVQFFDALDVLDEINSIPAAIFNSAAPMVSDAFGSYFAANPSVKPSLGAVAAAATDNVALAGTFTVDGRMMTNGDRYLRWRQTNPAENGVYIYNSAGVHSRSTDMDAAGDFLGARVSVSGGNTLAGNTYQCQSVVTTVGTDPVTIALIESQSTAVAAESAARIAADAALTSKTSQLFAQTYSAIGHYGDLANLTSGAAIGSNKDIVWSVPIEENQRVTRVQFRAVSAGTVYFTSWSRSGDTFTLIDKVAVIAAAGFNDVPVTLKTPAGCYVGGLPSGNIVSVSGASTTDDYFLSASTGGVTSFTDTVKSGGLWGFKFIIAKDVAGYAEALKTYDAVIGGAVAPFSPTLSTYPGNKVFADLRNEFTTGSYFDTIDVEIGTDTNLIAHVYKKTGDNFVSVRSKIIPLTVGSYTAVPVGLRIDPGEYPGSTVGGVKQGGGDQMSVMGYGTVLYNFTDADTSPIGAQACIRYNCRRPATVVKSPSIAFYRSSVMFPTSVAMIINTGQSLAFGRDTKISTAIEYDNQIIYNNNDNESPLVGALSYAWELFGKEDDTAPGDVDYKYIGTSRAMSAQTIAALSKNGSTPIYANVIGDVSSVQPDRVEAINWTQGEADKDTPEANYYAALVALTDDYNTDIKAITGQPQDVLLFTYQTCSQAGAFDKVAQAQLRAAQTDKRIYMANPNYFMDFFDGLHYTAISAKWAGGYFALARKRTINDGKPFEPLWPERSAVVGNAIDLYFNKSGLQFDTTNMPAQINQGFTVKDAGGAAVAISGVSVIGSNRVRIVCAAAPGAGWQVNYGENTVTGKPNGFAGHGGNLRDNAGDTLRFVDPYTNIDKPMHNWSVLFQWTV